MAGFLGMRGTGDWGSEVRPKNFRQGILKLFPNGSVPITAMTSMMPDEKVNDPEFKWWDKELETQTATSVEIYTDSALGSAVSGSGESAGVVFYVKVSVDEVKHFRPGQTVIMTTSATPMASAYGQVSATQVNGSSSYVAVELLIATTGTEVSAADTLEIIGDANAEGANMPEAVSYDPTKYSNFCQIIRTPLDITRTAKLTFLRTGDAYQELKREALLYHGVGMEQAFMFGQKLETTGSNGKPMRFTQGIVPFAVEHAPSANIKHYPTVHSGSTWLEKGEFFLDTQLEVLFQFMNTTEVMGLCGSTALMGIQSLVKNAGQFNFKADETAYGIKIVRWTTPWGDIALKQHPLLTHRAHRRSSLILLNPANLRTRFISDTFFKSDDSLKKGGYQGYDGQKEEFLTEIGLEMHYPKTFMVLTGVGVDG